MHFFVWAKKCQETHQHCMLDRYAFLPSRGTMCSHKKAWQKMLYHMVASRCESHFSVLANGYRYLNKEIEQLANLKRTLRILANEWLGTMASRVRKPRLLCETNSTPQRPIEPHEICVKKITCDYNDYLLRIS